MENPDLASVFEVAGKDKDMNIQFLLTKSHIYCLHQYLLRMDKKILAPRKGLHFPPLQLYQK